MGDQAVGCMIVASPLGFDKTQYRTYTIRSAEKADDYAMLKEVLKRRLTKLSTENYPSLMIIDGGRGHLGVAAEILQGFNIKDIQLVCMSKGPDRNSGREFFHLLGQKEFQLPRRSAVLHYLHILRNEAHHFAITTHRKKRSKEVSKSKLDDITGIGKGRKLILLHHFGSVDEIRNASLEDLCKVKGINKKTAKIVFDYLH
jgi:excinuclease ABC subunit C